MGDQIKDKQVPMSVQWKGKLGIKGLFAILARARRGDKAVDHEETIMTLTPTEAVALGGILVSEGNAKLKELALAGC